MQRETIGERYEVTGRLGRGGMATVYRARDARLLRDVAVKVLPRDQQREDSDFFFHREARAIAAMRHPNIVQIFDYSGPNEQPVYIVMELVEGINLDKMLLDRHPLPGRVILAIAHGIASALAHAHEGGVIHRDLKPANVMVEETGRVVLTDFGIAKAYRDAGKLGQTLADRATRLFGTPDFMAPEQVLERAVGPHTDVFALGAMIYCLGMCRSPFAHENTVETLRKVVDADYVPLRRLRADLAKGISRVVAECLQVSESARPTAETVAARCESLLVEEGIANPQRAVRDFLTAKGAPTERPTMTETIHGRPDAARASTTQPSVASEAPTEVTEIAPVAAPSQPRQKEASPVPSHTEEVWGDNAGTQTHYDASRETVLAAPETTMPHVPSTAPGTARVGRVEAGGAMPPPPVEKRGGSALWALLAVGLGLGALGAVVWVSSKPDTRSTVVTPVPVVTESEPTSTVSAPIPTETPPSPSQPEAAEEPPMAEGAARAPPSPPPSAPEDLPEAEPAGSAGSASNAAQAPSPTNRRTRSKRKLRRRSEETTAPAVVGEGTIEVRVKPWGTVFLDGKRLGNTPMVRRVQTSSGNHIVKVQHPSLGERSQTVRVKPDQTVDVNVDLRE